MPQQMKGNVRPPLQMPERRDERKYAPKVEVPRLITLYAWLCFFRAGVYLVFAFIVGLAPDSSATNYVATHFDSAPRQISPEAVFFISAGLYALIGWRWYCRDWRARWFAMFTSGAGAARILIVLAADRASGTTPILTAGQQQVLALIAVFNLMICAYLAFYPGMAEAFKETPWE
jgi:hypothetical protein